MGYAVEDSHVRASLFKPSGKWYEDLVLDMGGEYNTPMIHRAVWNALQKKGRQLEDGWMLVVLEPYHVNSHPVMLTGGRNYA